MNLYEQFGTNKDLETEGRTITYGPEGSTTSPEFTIARMGSRNRAYQAMFAKRTKPYQRQISNGTVDNSVLEKIMLEVFCKTVLKGWKNVTDRAGKPLEFSVENAVQLFNDLPDLYADLLNQAQSAETFRVEELDEVAKN